MKIRNEIKKQESSLTSGINIKIGLRIALLMVGTWFAYKVGISVISVIGIYILVRSVFSIIRLSVKIIFHLFSILFLTAIVSLVLLFIF
ncbi:hypothetical protein [Dysgonomonas sp. 520]|uniref:hypothetical protein n=1 Tax=Dysgonomonas sp. 520 TaxID=2302931 RepID=UPI0013D4A491|nr:hypothetical protein [Dysgonomonas sp. 520]NDW09814.1 hypothetical protein [Dysgonomonas sp. 520]